MFGDMSLSCRREAGFERKSTKDPTEASTEKRKQTFRIFQHFDVSIVNMVNSKHLKVFWRMIGSGIDQSIVNQGKHSIKKM